MILHDCMVWEKKLTVKFSIALALKKAGVQKFALAQRKGSWLHSSYQIWNCNPKLYLMNILPWILIQLLCFTIKGKHSGSGIKFHLNLFTFYYYKPTCNFCSTQYYQRFVSSTLNMEVILSHTYSIAFLQSILTQ